MILLLLLLTYTLYFSPASCRLTPQEFEDTIGEICFPKKWSREEDTRVNGQENSLPNTLENFISLAEKFEVANPFIDFKDELFYFLKTYVHENIEVSSSGTSQWKPPNSDLYTVEKLWEPDDVARERKLDIRDPFTDPEKCSLYFMISHSIINNPSSVEAYRSYGNVSSNGVLRSNWNPDEFYPREIGVVAIHGTDAAVSLSRVLYGLYVGLNPNRKVDLRSFKKVEKFPSVFQQEKVVDTLYTVTISEVLALAGWSLTNRKNLAPNGQWRSIYLDGSEINDFCPMVYYQRNATSIFSYSSVRGAADGLILGMVAEPVIRAKPRTRLSQILRMYYSRDGVSVDPSLRDVVSLPRASFCNRNEILDPLEKMIDEQTELYYYLVVETLRMKDDSMTNARNIYAKNKRDIYEMAHTVLQDYCTKVPSLDQPENLPRETFLDVIVVMDSSNSQESFQKQQIIVGNLAKRMDLRYTGSRMTILQDQRIKTDSAASSRIELKPVVDDTYSSSCAACTVAQIAYESSQMEKYLIIQAIDQFLQEKKENETSYHGANGKVVIYFNFESDGMQSGSNQKIQGRLERALRDLYLHHQDVLLYAVGLNEEVLRKFTKHEKALVSLTGVSDEEAAKKLYERISNAPAQLRYPDCKIGNNEGTAVFENFVSPNTVQHWAVSPLFFYKSRNLKVFFESQYGPIKVCHNRATMKPELEAKNCNTTIINNRIEFRMPNPCMGFNEITCSPFYFAVMGVDSIPNGNTRANEYCVDTPDHWCSSLDQIKFRVIHEGMRCSGSIGLRSLPVIILFFTALFTYILHKRF